MFQRSSLIFAAAGLLVLSAAGPSAAACRDAKGHFAACPAPVARAAKAERCRSAEGKFVSCSAKSAVAAGAPAAAIVPAGPIASDRASAPMASATSMAAAGGPSCKKGKRCGNACISVKDVCHK